MGRKILSLLFVILVCCATGALASERSLNLYEEIPYGMDEKLTRLMMADGEWDKYPQGKPPAEKMCVVIARAFQKMGYSYDAILYDNLAMATKEDIRLLQSEGSYNLLIPAVMAVKEGKSDWLVRKGIISTKTADILGRLSRNEYYSGRKQPVLADRELPFSSSSKEDQLVVQFVLQRAYEGGVPTLFAVADETLADARSGGGQYGSAAAKIAFASMVLVTDMLHNDQDAMNRHRNGVDTRLANAAALLGFSNNREGAIACMDRCSAMLGQSATAKSEHSEQQDLVCGTASKVESLVVGVSRFTMIPADGSGKKVIYFDNEEDACNDLVSDKNKVVFCLNVKKQKNDLGLEAIGVKEKSIFWGKNCVVPN